MNPRTLLLGLGLLAWSSVALADGTLADCADATDNDGDGLVDMNDGDCDCGEGTQLFTKLESYISNGSFESYSECPKDISQMEFCEGWQQGTSATSDYFNCGLQLTGTAETYFGSIPFPVEGSAAVGGLMSPELDIVEYIGACTEYALSSGVTYTLTMWVASPTGGIHYFGGDTSGELQLFGVESCGELPISTKSSVEGSYELLDEVTVSLKGGSAYQLVSFTFTPSTDFDALIFGAADDMSVESGLEGNYVLFDALTLDSAVPLDTELQREGDCESGWTLSGLAPQDLGLQWYESGVAIAGATASEYSVPPDTEGTFVLRLDDGVECNTTTNVVTIDCGSDEEGGDVAEGDEEDRGTDPPNADDDAGRYLGGFGCSTLSVASGEATPRYAALLAGLLAGLLLVRRREGSTLDPRWSSP